MVRFYIFDPTQNSSLFFRNLEEYIVFFRAVIAILSVLELRITQYYHYCYIIQTYPSCSDCISIIGWTITFLRCMKSQSVFVSFDVLNNTIKDYCKPCSPWIYHKHAEISTWNISNVFITQLSMISKGFGNSVIWFWEWNSWRSVLENLGLWLEEPYVWRTQPSNQVDRVTLLRSAYLWSALLHPVQKTDDG